MLFVRHGGEKWGFVVFPEKFFEAILSRTLEDAFFAKKIMVVFTMSIYAKEEKYYSIYNLCKLLGGNAPPTPQCL